MQSNNLNTPAKAGITGHETLEEMTEKIRKLFPDAKSPEQLDIIDRFASATKYRRQVIMDGGSERNNDEDQDVFGLSGRCRCMPK